MPAWWLCAISSPPPSPPRPLRLRRHLPHAAQEPGRVVQPARLQRHHMRDGGITMAVGGAVAREADRAAFPLQCAVVLIDLEVARQLRETVLEGALQVRADRIVPAGGDLDLADEPGAVARGGLLGDGGAVARRVHGAAREARQPVDDPPQDLLLLGEGDLPELDDE